MKESVLNKRGKFGVKILWRNTEMAIFVLRCFILTHPVYHVKSQNCMMMMYSLHSTPPHSPCRHLLTTATP